MSHETQANPDALAQRFLKRIGDQRVDAMRGDIWRLTQELSMIRGMLPEPDLLEAAAKIIDIMVPDDPEPEVQKALRDWAQLVRYIQENSRFASEAYDAMVAALEYEKRLGACSVNNSPENVSAARKAHGTMLEAIQKAKPLFKHEEPTNGRGSPPT